jgi:hypothetical protein
VLLEIFSCHRADWLPIGWFVIRADDRVILIDVGAY